MNATRLFLFMSLSLATVSVAMADTATSTDISSSTSTTAPKHAAKKKKAKKKKEPIPETPVVTEVTIPMAKGELQAEVANDQAQRDCANAPRTQVELGVSSWKPNRVTTYSRIAGTTDFATKGIPSLDASFFAPVYGRQIHIQFGLGFLALERSGIISNSGINVPQTENGYVTTLRLGATYSPWSLMSDRLVPYVSGALLPSMLITHRSSFDDGTNDTGVPFEFGAGALISAYKTLSVDLGITETLGSVQQSDFKGFAVRAGLRMPI
ncbi:MAG: hypothetical protein ACXVCG_20680 [Bdellovibrionota bacterium]